MVDTVAMGDNPVDSAVTEDTPAVTAAIQVDIAAILAGMEDMVTIIKVLVDMVIQDSTDTEATAVATTVALVKHTITSLKRIHWSSSIFLFRIPQR